MALTYNSLFTYLQNYIKRDSTDTQVTQIIPVWIENAQRRISLELKSIYNRTVVQGNLTAGQYVFPKPIGWRQTISLLIMTPSNPVTAPSVFNTTVELFPRQYAALNNTYPSRATSSVNNPPAFYADYDVNNYFIAPTPALAYPFEFTYYANPPFITPTNQENFYTEFMPDLLLKACLVETPGYLKKPDQAQVWQQDYASLLAAYNMESKGRIIDQANIRTEGQA